MSSSRRRVAIIAFNHESNTFIPSPTTLKHFRESVLLVGEEIPRRYLNAHHEVGGMLRTLGEEGIDPVPILFAHAAPWGMVDDEAVDTLWAVAQDGLRKAGALDGVLAANHGAGVNASRPDLDGWWLGRLRETVGADVPLIATIDPHANLTGAMVRACDALIAYRENPHLDQRQRGEEAARLMARTLRREVRPVVAAVMPAIAINIERQLSFAEPILSVKRELERVRAIPGILSVSVTLGFPYADVAELGSGFVVVADRDALLAQRQGERLAEWLRENRELFRGRMIDPAAAVALAMTSPKPVGLLDMGDNMGGGAPGDSTVLARLCLERGLRGVFWHLPDPESAAQAIAAGVGTRIRLSLGGKMPMSPAPPLAMEGEVLSIHDGRFFETKPRHGGRVSGDMGATVIVRAENSLTVMITTRRNGPLGSVAPICACGLKPEDFEIFLIKGVHAPVGGYGEVCPTLIRVNTPGVTTADMSVLEYRFRRRPLFPFEE